MEKIYIFITFALLLPGIIGVIIPVLPSIPYMFVVSFIYALITKFKTLNTTEIIVLVLIAVFSLVIDYLSGIIGAKYGGATKRSLLCGLVGSIIGTIILPPFGGIFGLFAGIFLCEISTHNDHRKAVKAASSGVIGSLTGILINLVLAIIFLVCFLIFTLK